MSNGALSNFIKSLHEGIVEAMDDADDDPADPQYRLGVRRLAKLFFDRFELFELHSVLPEIEVRDVDSWYAGRENRHG